MNLDYKIKFRPAAIKDLKRLKDKQLQKLIRDQIFFNIAKAPYKGDKKKANLKDIYTRPITYKRNQYRIAYSINDQVVTVEIIQVGSRERFYERLTRRLNKH
ncbi:type II toxin-antitoxin system mRNA interferase toxin, RelE/StbE family [Hutsoniella sourekii]